MELTSSKLTWKRSSQLIKVGTLSPTDDIETTKQKCADALNIFERHCDLVLIVKGAVIYKSAFHNLGTFMNALTPQQKSRIFLGLRVKVLNSSCFQVFTFTCTCTFAGHACTCILHVLHTYM